MITSRFAHFEIFRLNFLSSSFVIRVNLLHPSPSLLRYGSFLFRLVCLSYYVHKITQYTLTELLNQDLTF